SRRGEVRCPEKVTRQVHQAGYINRNAYATVATEIAVLDQVVPFRVGCAPLIPHAEIHGQLGTDLPIVLNVERGLFRLIGYRFEYRQAARAGIPIAQEKTGERIALQRIPGSDYLLCGPLCEVEKSRGGIWLEEVIEEDSLLPSELENVPAMHPGQCRTVRKQRVRKAGIRATLVEQRRCVVVHLDYGHAREAVDLAENCVARSRENRIQIGIIFRDRCDCPVNGKVVTQHQICRWTPVILERRVMHVGNRIKTVTRGRE